MLVIFSRGGTIKIPPSAMKQFFCIGFALIICSMSCQSPAASDNQGKKLSIVTLDPGHFHAALVQKTMYPDVSPHVHVYAPEGPDVRAHLARIEQYNKRAENPTNWDEELISGDDYFEKMLADKAGDVVVLSGNNRKKTEYILKSLNAGFNVLADKPMVIDTGNFNLLKTSFDVAAQKKLLLYDIMTERYEITTMLQRELSMIDSIFGELEKGSPDDPAITKESVHHFYKYVSGNVLTRPAWFLDVSQQGEGIVDVMTHLVDLVQWECFPEQVIDYTKDIQVNTAKRWPTEMSLSQFKTITKLDNLPEFLKNKVVNDSVLQVYSNGEINYTLRGVHAKTSVIWKYQAPEGAGDTHHSIMRGTKADLIIRQGADQQYKPTLYIEPIVITKEYVSTLLNSFKAVQAKFPGVELKQLANLAFEVVIPEKYKEGHEAHFGRVTEKFLEYLKNGNMPAWEVPNMIAKYYTTTKGLQVSMQK
jgi:predicted dehydrogenase